MSEIQQSTPRGRAFAMRCDHLDGWVSEITAHETAMMIVVTHLPSGRAWRAMKSDITEAVELSRRIVAEQRAKDAGAPGLTTELARG